MTEWMKLDPEKLNHQHEERIDGVGVTVFLSPHDVPTAMRSGTDPGTEGLIIEFQYLDDEPWQSEPRDKGITLRVCPISPKTTEFSRGKPRQMGLMGQSLRLGKHSGRLYGIEIASSLLKGESVSPGLHVPELVGKAIDDLATRRVRRARSVRGNYRAAKEALAGMSDELFSALMAGKN